MAFFFSDNPIALFLALVVVVAVLRVLIGRLKWFQGSKAAYILPVLLGVILLLLIFPGLLSTVSYGLPFFMLLVMFLFALGALFFALGVQKGIWEFLKQSSLLKTILKIVIICIIALAASSAFGERLLEDTSVSIVDAIEPEQEDVEIDFAPIFTRQALGLILIITILGLAFVFINLSR